MALITDSKEIASLCDELKNEKFVTVDTEFIRDKSYYPKLCLIQISGSGLCFAIDALADGVDLTPVDKLLSNKKIVKVFHSARQDIEIFYNHFGHIPSPLFDTQVAATVCGFGDAVSYEKLVTQLTDANIDKSSRFTDWSKRPLTETQIAYALSDVLYLREIYEKLSARLDATKRESWLEEEMEDLTDIKKYQMKPEDAWKRMKVRSNSARFLKVVREVTCWREKQAQKKDLPRGFILKDQTILDIAASMPRTKAALYRTRGINQQSLKGKAANELLNIIHEVLEISDEKLPPVPDHIHKPTKKGPLVDLLKVLLKGKCKECHVADRLVATTDDLALIAELKDPAHVQDIPCMHGWRYDVFGKDALDLKAGKIALTAEGNTLHILPLCDSVKKKKK